MADCENNNFFLDGRLGLDDCALAANEKQNKSIDDYYLFDPRGGCEDRKFENVAQCNNMVVNNGYGYTDGCNVDVDSRLRNGGEITDEISSVLKFGYKRKREWLEYNIKRSLGIESSKEEQELG